MVRILGFFVGLAFSGVLLLSLLINGVAALTEPAEPNVQEEFHLHPKALALASDGPFGKFDRQQLQRGYQVYKEVCSACHSLSRVAIRDLGELGYNEGQVKNEAASFQVPGINPDTGEPALRKGLPSDYFPSPYANETAARAANNNAAPPDLSLMTKAREGGAAYVYSLLTGYRDPKTYRNAEGQPLPKDAMPASETLHFNPYFANLNLAMPAPLKSDGQVAYSDGTKASVDQMAKDVAAFLVWTAEPKLEARHRYGLVAVVILLFATIFGYMAYQQIWAEAKRKVAPKGPLEPANQAKRTRARKKAGIEG